MYNVPLLVGNVYLSYCCVRKNQEQKVSIIFFSYRKIYASASHRSKIVDIFRSLEMAIDYPFFSTYIEYSFDKLYSVIFPRMFSRHAK